MPKTNERIRPFALRIPEKLFLDIQDLARQEKRSINAQILHMLEQSQAHNLKSEPEAPPAKLSRSWALHTWCCLKQQICWAGRARLRKSNKIKP